MTGLLLNVWRVVKGWNPFRTRPSLFISVTLWDSPQCRRKAHRSRWLMSFKSCPPPHVQRPLCPHFCQSLTLSLFVFIFDGFIFIGYLGRPSTPERLAPAVCHCALHNERLSDSDCHSNRFFAFRFVFRLAGGEFPQWSVHALRLHHSRLRCLQGGNDRRRIYGGRLTSTIHFIIAAQYHSANVSNANVPILLFNFEGQTEISSLATLSINWA